MVINRCNYSLDGDEVGRRLAEAEAYVEGGSGTSEARHENLVGALNLLTLPRARCDYE